MAASQSRRRTRRAEEPEPPPPSTVSVFTPAPIPSYTAEELAAWIDGKGLNQRDAAVRLGVGQSTLSRALTTGGKLRPFLAERLHKVLGEGPMEASRCDVLEHDGDGS